MARISDGGWAFPRPAVQGARSYEDNEPAEPGMSVRVWLAGKALSALAFPMGPETTPKAQGEYIAEVADLCVVYADAVLARLDRQPATEGPTDDEA